MLAAVRGCFAPVFVCALACAPTEPSGAVDDDLVLTVGTGSDGGAVGGSSEGDACADACEPGAALCVDGGLAVCEAGEAGCPGWSAPAACPEDHVCSEGACAPGLGFSRLADAWALPTGGRGGAGFWAGDGEPEAVGDDVWTLIDLDGDGARDLVVTAAAYKSGDGWVTRTLGFPQAPFWEIHYGGADGGFSGPEAWLLPAGVGLFGRGLVDVAGDAPDLSDHAWTLRDVDGDGRPELIVTAIGGFDGAVEPLGDEAEPHWDVYRNTGIGFTSAPQPWLLPPGPDAPRMLTVDGSVPGPGGVAWSLVDLDADGWSDLVITARVLIAGFVAPGFPDSPYWELHRGGPDGVAAEATPWALPPGGGIYSGFAAPSGGGAADGDQLWALLDLDGDGAKELVVTGAQGDGAAGARVLSGGPGPHWRVHRSNGGGFAPSPETYAVPAEGGGAGGRGYYAVAGGREPAGSAIVPYDATGWELQDLDGDGWLDLVVTNEARLAGATYSRRALGVAAGDADPYWEVHRGADGGFLAAERWQTPRGGVAGRGFLWSAGLASPVPQVEGASMWTLTDLDGDRRPELVVTGLAAPTGQGAVWDWRAPGLADGAPHWQVFWQPVARSE